MKYRLYAINEPFQHIMKNREACFLKLFETCDENQKKQVFATFDVQAIYSGCKSLLEDETLDIQETDITMYRSFRNEFFHMRVHETFLELNHFIDSPFYHYLMRLHKEYIVVDEFAHVHYQKYCKNNGLIVE